MSGTHVTVENFLTEHRPHHLSTWLHVGGIGEPAGIVGEAGSVEEGAAQPDEDHGQVAEVSTKNLPRDLLKVTRVAIEIVSVGVEVPNPGCGLGAFRKSSVEMPGLAEQFKGRRVVDLDKFALASAPTLWWAFGHRVVPRGTGSRWRATPPANRTVHRGPGHSHKGRSRAPVQARKNLTITGALGPKEGTAVWSIESREGLDPHRVTKVQSGGGPVCNWYLVCSWCQREPANQDKKLSTNRLFCFSN